MITALLVGCTWMLCTDFYDLIPLCWCRNSARKVVLFSRPAEAIDFLSVVARLPLYQIIFPGILGEKWRTLLPGYSPCPLPDHFS